MSAEILIQELVKSYCLDERGLEKTKKRKLENPYLLQILWLKIGFNWR